MRAQTEMNRPPSIKATCERRKDIMRKIIFVYLLSAATSVAAFAYANANTSTNAFANANGNPNESDAPAATTNLPQPAGASESVGTKDAPEKPEKPEKPDKSVKEGESSGGDTYNFYFQKGEGAQSVEQGIQQKVQPSAAPTPTNETTHTTEIKEHLPPPPREAEYGLPAFSAQLGYFATPAHSASGWLIGGQFNPSEMFGIQLHFLSMREDTAQSSSFTAMGENNDTVSAQASGALVGAAFTPFLFNRASHPVRVSGLLGVAMINVTEKRVSDSFSAMGSNTETSGNNRTLTLPYAGLSVSVQLAKHFEVGGFARFMSKNEYDQVGLSVGLLF